MTRSRRKTLWIGAALLTVALSPLRSDGDTAQCRNVTGTELGHVNDPVNGDEAFFRLPSGPSNVMMLLDNSGSMRDLPQCESGDFSRTGTSGDCTAPPLPLPAVSGTAAGSFAVSGTCRPATDPALTSSQRNTAIAWMESIRPVDTLADPGHTPVVAGTGMHDSPPWSVDCLSGTVTDNHCLFDPRSYYTYDSWSATTNGTDTATRAASDTDPALTTGCRYRVGTLTFDMGPACTSCMADHGYYFFRIGYRTTAGGSVQDTGVKHRFSGRFLNANPPKYVTARYVVKDIAWSDPNAPKLADELRLGLSILRASGSSGSAGATLVVPLGPDRSHSYPYSFASFQPVRQLIIDAVNGKRADSTTVTGAFKPYDSYTPIGSALFQIGQYFAAPGFYTQSSTTTAPCQVSCTYAQRNTIPSQCQDVCHLVSGRGRTGTYQCSSATQTCTVTVPRFSGTGPYDQGWQSSSWVETASGTTLASWAVTGDDAQGNPIQCTECWACQKNSVVVITDGMPNQEITFPTAITSDATINADYAIYCGNNSCSNAQATNPLAPKIAEWIHMTELRPGTSQSAKHAIAVHAIGFSVTDTASQNTLRAIAGMGGGTSAFAGTQSDLLAAVWAAVNTAVPRETSFSAASANSLQTIQTAASDAYLTRFLPNDVDPAWEGHLFQGALFDEFLNGCDPTKPPSGQAQVLCPTSTPPRYIPASFGYRVAADGNALCDGVYLVDLNCDVVAEDPSTGFFVKQSDGVTPAQFSWDAGDVLSNPARAGHVTAADRRIFTWIDGARVDLTTANAATLKPYMNIDATWCTSFLSTIHVAGGTDPTTTCAAQVINFARGWDVMDFDADGCGGPGRSTNATSCPGGVDGEERNRANDARSTQRFWKLGDIFHSSPAVVTAPIDPIRCDTGYEKQCVPTIRSPSVLPSQTSNPAGAYAGLSGNRVDAYERYRLDNRERRRVVLVGANDGMLHAFDGGLPSSCDSLGVCSYSSGSGTGEELWAFVPPDLLPRLRAMLTDHQYMVDGSVMVRDVWVDGGASGTGTKDHVKQSDEFHTLAIFGERSGGTQFTALDVTVPDDPSRVRMLWTFPRPLTTDAFYMGQSWLDFAPRPPPVGPVRIADATDARGWTEQWIVMLSGGYDPAMTRGRAVFMVDAWTGNTLWRYTDDTFKSQLGYGSGTSMFPVAAAVAMVDIGEPSSQTFDSDGFFDTGTWGDLGGNLFVARFWAPGVKDATSGLVTNWHAARAFEEQRQTDDGQVAAGRSEFFYMTSNAFEPGTRSLRTFLGSGNRERLMQQGAACGPDNLLGCCQTGCSVTSTTADTYGACGVSSTFQCTSAGVMTQAASSAATWTCGSSAVCTAPTRTVSLGLDCGSGHTASATASATCDANGVCPAVYPMGSGHDLTPPNAVARNRFYGIWSYGGIATRTFSDQATARTFDANRFTDRAYATTCTGTRGNACSLVETTYAEASFVSDPRMATIRCTSGTSCSAVATDPGWFYEYGHACPAASCVDATWNDEKTGAGATVVLGCSIWSGMRPYGQASGGDPCTNLATPITYGYMSDYVSGAPSASCGYTGQNLLYRAAQRSTTAPPSAPLVRVTVNAAGQVAYSTLQLDSGSPPANTQVGVRTDLFQPMYWLEVPRALHNCRHGSSGACE